MPSTSLAVRTVIVKALVASSRFSENFADSAESSRWMSPKRFLPSGGSSAPPRRKSRSSFSTIFRCGFESSANCSEAASALYFPLSARFCASSVWYCVILGRLELYASRIASLSSTLCRWPTTPQARESRSFASSSGCTNSSQVAGVSTAARRSISARASPSNASTAGETCSGFTAAKRGSPVNSSNGFISDSAWRGRRAVDQQQSGGHGSLVRGGWQSGVLHGTLGRAHRVFEQHGDGHRAHAAWNGREVRGAAQYALEIHIAGELAVRQTIDADVNHHRARFNHLAGQESCAADGRDEDVRLARHCAQVPCLGVAD